MFRGETGSLSVDFNGAAFQDDTGIETRYFKIAVDLFGNAVIHHEGIIFLTPCIKNPIVKGVSGSQSGIGGTVFPGEAVGIAIQTAGTGTVQSFDLSGEKVFVGDSLL